MNKLKNTTPPPLYLLLTLCLLASSLNVKVEGAESTTTAGGNPFTPQAYLIRYWKNHISNDLPKPWFFLNKASPMTPAQLATFSKLADQNSLSTQLPDFCKSANLLCFPDLSPSLEKHEEDVKFSSYLEKNFTNYGTDRAGGVDSFKKYDSELNSFRRYGRDSAGHDDKFSNYAPGANVVDQSFNTYGAGASGGAGNFITYNENINDADLRFTSYSQNGNGRKQSFKTYNNASNGGLQSFTSYTKDGNGAENDFITYSKNSNVMESNFNNYGETGNGVNDKFTSYGFNTNQPQNNFKAYGTDGNGAVETFKAYRGESTIGVDSFQSYAKSSNSAQVKFDNYGQSDNLGTDMFKGYGQNAKGQTVGFKTYVGNYTFKEYAKKGVSFAGYVTENSEILAPLTGKGKMVKNKWVEPGRFFRERMLKTGVVMPMPDIKDKMPVRSFLPRAIAAKLPFSSVKIDQMKKIFHAGDDSAVAKMFTDALGDCERAPSPGETKRCVGSAEDMIDFATLVLGPDVMVQTTENTKGSNGSIMIGSVKGINGGKLTKSVSCHQSLLPYLLYYCHSVPKVRVYEADILDPKSKAKINHGVAICHIDTSAWSPTHGAFIALGSGPGKIEVCHWIFENDMTWTVAD